MLEATGSERSQVMGELAASLTTMLEIINSGGLPVEFVADAIQINEVGLTALAWAQNVEEQLLSGLESDGGRDVASPTRLMKLQKQVEVSLALLVSAQAEDERKHAVDAILELIALLKRDIQIAEIRRQESQATELRALETYLEQATSTHRKNPGSLVSEQDVSILEERMFAFVEAASQLDSSLKAAQLMAEMEKLRADLATTRIALERANDVSMTNFINRVGDLQENLAEIQYQVKSKHLLHSEMAIATTTTATIYSPPPALPVHQSIPQTHQIVQQHTYVAQPLAPSPSMVPGQVPSGFAPSYPAVSQQLPPQVQPSHIHMVNGQQQQQQHSNGQVQHQPFQPAQGYMPSNGHYQPPTGTVHHQQQLVQNAIEPRQTAPYATNTDYPQGYPPTSSQPTAPTRYVGQPPFAHQIQPNQQPFAAPSAPSAPFATPRTIDMDAEFEL
jgi:hypothetical protein